MNLKDLFRLSFSSLRSRLSRFILTVFGLSVAIGVILFLVSLGFGLQHLLLQQIATSDSLLSMDVVSPDEEILPLSREQVDDIKTIEGVEMVAPQSTLPAFVSMGGINSQASANIVSSDFFSLDGLLPEQGRIFEPDEEFDVVINESLSNLFGLTSGEIVGTEIDLALFVSHFDETENVVRENVVGFERKFNVVGVIGAGSEPYLYVNANVLEGVVAIDNYDAIKVKVVDDGYLQAVREDLIERGYLVSALSDTIAEANRIFQIIQVVLGIFGVFALIVAAIGLINTMTINLLERTNEIGVMRSLGASSKTIKSLFLVESTLAGALSGVIGILSGIIFSELVNFGLNILARVLGGSPVSLFIYPIWFLLFIVLLSTFVGFIAGLWPASRAGRLNPLEALRYK